MATHGIDRLIIRVADIQSTCRRISNTIMIGWDTIIIIELIALIKRINNLIQKIV